MSSTPTEERPRLRDRSLGSLIGSLPDLVSRLIRGEIQHAKQEIAAKLKAAGVGAGLLVGAAILAIIFLQIMLAAAIIALSLVLPAWAAALIVGGVVLIIVIVLALVGVKALKTGVPPVPTDTVENVKSDIRAIKGEGEYDNAGR
ncbi:putative superfamily III holin-X [Labedella gwakjiensis]|uniref:Phage holin family protein n=1 Tax=Labedella gwakjiensis TaxID=390269 RepID=A0A2P8GT34_9MICO|nr:phage holin family protein [Labedella gwakjiensis]PSL37114.1 putative superfamily III holin-X [Labedella gwakjiensis]RUQ81983.1 phage holin family protein [Labedella gwakjiensis]